MIITAIENILVVKLGGGAGLDMAASADDLAALAGQRPLVIVHGVSQRANQLSQQAGIPVQTITSPTGHTSRYTDPRTRDIYVQAAGQINAELVELLRVRGINAIGMTDSETAITGERKSAIRAVVDGRVRLIRDDYSGSITAVDGDLLRGHLEMGYTPVLPPMAFSADDGLLNIDGDRAAAAVAAALDAEELVILSNVRGLYRSFPDETSFVQTVSATNLGTALEWAQGRMKRKVLGAQEALNGGVSRVVIADGRIARPVQAALNGEGTVFTR